MFTAQQVANALAPQGVPSGNVIANWPSIVAGLTWAGIDDHFTEIAAAATIVVETGSFQPIPEEGDEAYFRRELGNDWYYHGRGFLQITWRSNYAHYGAELGVDLVANPDLALQPALAAKILALYFKERGIPAMANAGNWVGVRVAVNGGENGLQVYLAAVNALLPLHDGPPPAPVTTVATPSILRTVPVKNGVHVPGPGHPDGLLPVGTVVHFTPDTAQGPYHGKEVTPHFAHVVVGKGPYHGWTDRINLKTVQP